MVRETDIIYADYINITDVYLGDLIEDIVMKHYEDIDLSDEYGELLEYISMNLLEGFFGTRDADPIKYERTLRRIVNNKDKAILTNVISYLISKYIEDREHLK